MKLRPRFGLPFALVAIAALLLSAGPLFGQVDVTAGRIAGEVTDEGGAPLPGASVEAKNKGTGLTLIQVTDARGLYRILGMPGGPYDVTASLPGFQKQVRGSINVTVGAAVTVDFRLRLASISKELTVTAEAPVIETTQTSDQTTVDSNAIRSLPSNGRNFTSFVLLTPNSQVETQRGYLALSGQRGITTSFTVDGTDFNNSFFGGATGVAEGRSAFQVSQEAVREFQVIENGASVEFGRSGGGFINVVTKTGTNDFHGSAFYYSRPNGTVARFQADPNANASPASLDPKDQKTQQFGASLGAPFIKDKLFFFGAWDQQKQSTTQAVDARMSTDAGAQSIFAKYPGLASTPSYAWTLDGQIFFARLDLQASPQNHFAARANLTKNTGENLSRIGSQFASTYNGLEDDRSYSYVGQWNGTFTSNILNDLSFQYVKENDPRTDISPTLAEVDYGPTLRMGGVSFLPITATQDRFNVADTFTYLAGAHALKLGGEYNDTGMSQVFKGNWRGIYTFSGANDAALLANLLAGKWSQFRQFTGLNGLTADQAGEYSKRQKELAFFVQDQWYATPNLTVTLGVRYERQDNPNDPVLNPDSTRPVDPTNSAKGFFYNLNGTIPDANDQWSPRLSVAWTPEKSGKSVVRLSLGRYWSRTPAILYSQLYTNNGLAGTTYTINTNANGPNDPVCVIATCPGWGATFNPVGVEPLKFPAGAAIPAQGVFVVDNNYKNPRTDKISLSLERDVFGVALGLDGQYAKTYNLERLDDPNLQVSTNPAVDCPLLSSSSGVTCYSPTRPNPAYGRVSVYRSDGLSNYKAVTFSARKNFANGFRSFGSATWAQDKDSDSNERQFGGFNVEDVHNLEGNYGFADRDIKWRFSGNISYERNITKGFSVFTSAVYIYQTGRVYNAIVGSDINRDSESTTDRPTVDGVHFDRNPFRQPDFSSFDARLGFGYEIGPGKLSVFAEIFNLFNVRNAFVTQSRSTYGTGQTPSASFGIPTGIYSTPRTLQVAARYDF